LATETEPDWHSGEGNFGWRFQTDNRTNLEDMLVVASAEEIKRYSESRPEPDKHFHYRYQAATLAWEAAKFMPNNSDDTARLLCDAGSWLKAQDPDAADVFYKALVRRCRKTAIGSEADEIRWFPTFDDDGNIERTRLELLELPTPQELSSTEAISRYPIPGKFFLVKDGDHIRYIASAVRRLGISVTAKDIFAANPEIKPDDNITGRMIYIPVPGSDSRPETPKALGPSDPETPATAPDSNDQPPPVSESGTETPAVPATERFYVVQKGDTLIKIAMQFEIRIADLVDANGLSSGRVRIGQKLLIPDKVL
jgi:LysM repeat protein